MTAFARRSALLAATALGLLGLGFAAPAEARTNRALIVAVTDYPNLPKSATLAGPNNDAQLVREFLTTGAPVPFAPDDVTVLASNLPGAKAVPTLAAIETELARLAAEAERGDFVYLHFSGHGSQQPAKDLAQESDGLDEIFLPADTGMWDDATKSVPSAFQDDRIGAALQAIRDKGAFVWVVFDACHSGTATRAASTAGDDVAERQLKPEELGIPQAAMASAEGAAGTRSVGGPGASAATGERQAAFTIEAAPEGSATPEGATPLAAGGLVGFFAAQTVETTPEMKLPKGAADAPKLGLFTYTLLSKMAENPNITYRQLGQAVLQAYSGDNRTRPTPLFEGNLDTPIFGSEPTDGIQQWKINLANDTPTIPAGQLHRLAPGARLAILPSPLSAAEDVIGYAEVVSAKNLEARLKTIEHGGKQALTKEEIPAGAFARVDELAVDFELVIARPDPSSHAEDARAVDAALDAILADKQTPVNIRLVGPEESADLKLAVLSEKDAAILIADRAEAGDEAGRTAISDEPLLWFLPPTAEISLDSGKRPSSIALSAPETLRPALSENLVKIFRATNLSRLAAASDFRPEEVEVGFKIKRAESDTPEALLAGTVPIVHPSDEVHIAAKNSSAKPVDINVLFIGSDYSISHMYAERLHGGGEIDLPLLAFDESSFGMERMVVVLTEAKPQSPVEDLSFLEQIGVRQATRAVGGPEGFAGLLKDVAAAPETRGVQKLGASNAGSKGAVMIFPLETQPRG